MDVDLDELARRGGDYKPQRKTPTLFLHELHEALRLEYQNWSGPFDRGYQYEFFIEKGSHEVSLIVEISAVVPVAVVCFGYEDNEDIRTIRCSDEPERPAHRRFKEIVVAYLRNQGYQTLPLDALDARYDRKTLKELLIYDCED